MRYCTCGQDHRTYHPGAAGPHRSGGDHVHASTWRDLCTHTVDEVAEVGSVGAVESEGVSVLTLGKLVRGQNRLGTLSCRSRDSIMQGLELFMRGNPTRIPGLRKPNEKPSILYKPAIHTNL